MDLQKANLCVIYTIEQPKSDNGNRIKADDQKTKFEQQQQQKYLKISDIINSTSKQTKKNHMSGYTYSNTIASTSSSDNNLGTTNEKIYFVAILRNDEVLVKYSEYVGNFSELLQQLLPKIVRTNGIKMTLNYEEYTYISFYSNSTY